MPHHRRLSVLALGLLMPLVLQARGVDSGKPVDRVGIPPVNGDCSTARAATGKELQAAEAVKIFLCTWRTKILPGREDLQYLEHLVDDPPTFSDQTPYPHVAKIAYSALRARLIDVHGDLTKLSLLYGSDRNLQQSGSCFHIAYDGLMSAGLGACVDAATGEVALVWVIPEG